MSLESLKANRQKNLEALQTELNKKGDFGDNDPRYWYPQLDKAKAGSAIIRFLPAPEGESVPWVTIFSHNFQSPSGQWYIENCPSTVQAQDHGCPVCFANGNLWNTNIPANQDIVRKRSRRTQYTANILVINDFANPENNGQVRLFKFGKKIMEKIKTKMTPQIPTDEPIDVFDFWTGANFKLIIKNVDKQTNYDQSNFDVQSALFGGDEAKLDKVYKELNPLQPLIDPKIIKPIAKLVERYNKIMGNPAGLKAAKAPAANPVASTPSVAESAADIDTEQTVPTTPAPTASTSTAKTPMQYFEELAKETS